MVVLLVQKKLLNTGCRRISRRSSGSETPQAPEFVAAPTAPVEEPVAAPQGPEFVAAPAAPVEEPVALHKLQSLLQRQLPCWREPVAAPQAPEFVAAPTAPEKNQSAAPQAPEFVAAPAAPAEEPVAAPVQEPAPQAAPANGPAFQQAYQQPTQLINKLLTKVNQDNLILPNQVRFGVAVGGYWNWFLSALKRPTAVENPKALNRIFTVCLDCLCLGLSTFFTASGATDWLWNGFPLPYVDIDFPIL